jgi:hypothetical protein
MNEIDQAERMQAWKAFLIPSSLFVACLFNAAGIYILYTGNSIGVVFVGLGFGIIAFGMFAFITFHNKHREQGHYKRVPDDVIDATPDRHDATIASGVDELTPVDPIPAFHAKPPAQVR